MMVTVILVLENHPKTENRKNYRQNQINSRPNNRRAAKLNLLSSHSHKIIIKIEQTMGNPAEYTYTSAYQINDYSHIPEDYCRVSFYTLK